MAIANKLQKYQREFVLTFLMILLWGGARLTGNEEHYLGLAKQYANPEWMPHSFSLNDWAANRLWFQLIFGWMIGDFEMFRFIMSSLLAICTAIPIIRIADMVRKGNKQQKMEQIVLIIAIYACSQSFIGSHTLLLGVESRNIAYLLAMWGIYFGLKDKSWTATAFFIAATWMHVLAGGWLFVYYVVYLIRKTRYWNAIHAISVYGIFIVPWLAYLKSGLVPGVDMSVYTAERVPHHSLHFLSMKHFLKEHFVGVCMIIVTLYYGRKFWKKHDLWVYTEGILWGALLFVLVSFIDRGGLLLKYLPFRPVAFATLGVVILLVTHYTYAIRDINTRYALAALLIVMPVMENLYNNTQDQMRTEYEWLKANTPADATFYDLRGEDPAAERLSERNQYVSWKKHPVTKIKEWKERIDRITSGDFSGVDYVLLPSLESIACHTLPKGKVVHLDKENSCVIVKLDKD